MDYEKAYKEALKRANEAYETYDTAGQQKVLEEIFPELKESEDERIRKWLIGYFENINVEIIKEDRNKIIAWLKSLYPQKKQEWGEEDKKMHNAVLQDLENMKHAYPTAHFQHEIEWLKSLRPQSKQEIDKENEAIIGRLKTEISLAKAFNRKHQEEVFGLIDFLRPQFHWKPSEEQMDALRNVAYGGLYYGDTPKLLKLYNELKALAK